MMMYNKWHMKGKRSRQRMWLPIDFKPWCTWQDFMIYCILGTLVHKKKDMIIYVDSIKKFIFDGIEDVMCINESSITHNSMHIWQQSILLGKGPIFHGTTSERWKPVRHYDFMIFILLFVCNLLNCVLG